MNGYCFMKVLYRVFRLIVVGILETFFVFFTRTSGNTRIESFNRNNCRRNNGFTWLGSQLNVLGERLWSRSVSGNLCANSCGLERAIVAFETTRVSAEISAY